MYSSFNARTLANRFTFGSFCSCSDRASVNITLPLAKMPVADIHDKNILHNIMPCAEKKKNKKPIDKNQPLSVIHLPFIGKLSFVHY